MDPVRRVASNVSLPDEETYLDVRPHTLDVPYLRDIEEGIERIHSLDDISRKGRIFHQIIHH